MADIRPKDIPENLIPLYDIIRRPKRHNDDVLSQEEIEKLLTATTSKMRAEDTWETFNGINNASISFSKLRDVNKESAIEAEENMFVVYHNFRKLVFDMITILEGMNVEIDLIKEENKRLRKILSFSELYD